jgi:DNA-3-methyladenine glycosylase I
MAEIIRCPWVTVNDLLYQTYHDKEWGVPLYDDKKLYEFLVLEAFQAGLSWRTVLYKRNNFKKAFANFNVNKVAKFGDSHIALLMRNEGIIRNKAKIKAAIINAQKFIEVKKEFGSFTTYMWRFVQNTPMCGRIKKASDYQLYSKEALIFTEDLKKRGFKFLGPTVVYAHMQAVGMVNDHMVDCFRFDEIKKLTNKQ